MNDLDKHLINLASANPRLSMPYRRLAFQIGIQHERLTRHIDALKFSGCIPRSFMPKHRQGRPKKDVHPHTIVLKEVKYTLGQLRKAGIKSLTVAGFTRLVREQEERVLSEGILDG